MLEHLILEPKNIKQRKRARRALSAAMEQYASVQRLGSLIQVLDVTRAHLLDQQLRLAAELRAAGAPMEGVVWREGRDAG